VSIVCEVVAYLNDSRSPLLHEEVMLSILYIVSLVEEISVLEYETRWSVRQL
jgi:hypothetical protein